MKTMIIRSDSEIRAVKNAITCCEGGALQIEALNDLLIALQAQNKGKMHSDEMPEA